MESSVAVQIDYGLDETLFFDACSNFLRNKDSNFNPKAFSTSDVLSPLYSLNGICAFQLPILNSFEGYIQHIIMCIGSIDKRKFRAIYFLSRTNLFDRYFIKHLRIKLKNKAKKIFILSIDDLIQFLTMPINAHTTERSFSDSYLSFYSSPAKKMDIFNRIFNYIFDEYNSSAVLPKPSKSEASRIFDKLNANFAASDNREYVAEVIRNNWVNIYLVDFYVKAHFDNEYNRLFTVLNKIETDFKNTFHRSHLLPINYPKAFFDIARKIIPPYTSDHFEVHSCCLAIVLYFFIMCDIGKSFVGEEPSLFKNFRNHNDFSE